MAKKTKVSSQAKDGSLSACEYSPSVYVDFGDLKEIKGLAVGDTVRVVIKGTVQSVEQRESYNDKGKVRASVSIKDFEAEIITDENQFDSLLEDEDD